MGAWQKGRLMAVSETGMTTALVADVHASDPADLRPLVTGKRVPVLKDPLGVTTAPVVRQMERCPVCNEFPKKCAQNGCWL